MGLVWTGLALSLGGFGCGPGSDPEASGGESEAAGSEPEPPEILDLTEVAVSAASREDITILAAGMIPNTRVELDGRSWSLSDTGPVVRAGQTLRIPLAGNLVVAEHDLVLVHDAGGETLRSEPLTIRVSPYEIDPLLGTLAPELLGAGDRFVDGGPGQDWLAIVDEVEETLELRTGDWSVSASVIAVPGLRASSGAATAGELDLFISGDWGGERSLVVAWLAAGEPGDPGGGTRVLGRITALDDDDQLGPPGPVIELYDLADPDQRSALGPHELARIDGLAVLDSSVVIAVDARRDAEAPTPGDRVLVTRSASPGAAAPVVLRGPGGRDLDLPRRSPRWLDLGAQDAALSVRVALGFPWLLGLAGNGLPVLAEDPGEAASAPGAPIWMASADGALGSRHSFALEIDDEGARVRVLRIDRWGAPGPDPSPLVQVIELPAIPTAAPSLSTLAGSPLVLIPFGVGTPAWAMRSTGETVLLDSLSELDCDGFALGQADVDGEDGELGAGVVSEIGGQRVACIAARELRLGNLVPVP